MAVVPAIKEIEEALGVPVAVDNDAQVLLALGEVWYGAEGPSRIFGDGCVNGSRWWARSE